MPEFRHCEFGHLLVWTALPECFDSPGKRWSFLLDATGFWGHTHEDEALGCAAMVRMGWPDPALAQSPASDKGTA